MFKPSIKGSPSESSPKGFQLSVSFIQVSSCKSLFHTPRIFSGHSSSQIFSSVYNRRGEDSCGVGENFSFYTSYGLKVFSPYAFRIVHIPHSYEKRALDMFSNALKIHSE